MILTEIAWQIVDSSEDPTLVVDGSSLAICYSNLAALKLTEVSRENGCELSDLPSWLNLSSEETPARVAAATAAHQGRFTHEVSHNGTFFEVRVQTLPTTGQIIVLFHDVTQRREVERTKQELVSTVSHELRSPMTAIKGAMGLLLAGTAGEIPERARDMIRIAQRNADRLILIVNDILDLDKIADGAMVFDNSEVRIANVIEAAVEGIVGFSQRFGVHVAVEIDTPDAVSFVDPNRLVQVLVNLLSNAIKFSPYGGTVTVGLTQQDGFNRLSVADNGEGIPTEQHELLFKRFAQIGATNRAATGGTGLGLSIVQAILDKQDGKISFESKVGHGTTFHVDIPIYTSELSPRFSRSRSA